MRSLRIAKFRRFFGDSSFPTGKIKMPDEHSCRKRMEFFHAEYRQWRLSGVYVLLVCARPAERNTRYSCCYGDLKACY